MNPMEPSHIFGRNNVVTEIQVFPEEFWLGQFRERYIQYPEGGQIGVLS